MGTLGERKRSRKFGLKDYTIQHVKMNLWNPRLCSSNSIYEIYFKIHTSNVGKLLSYFICQTSWNNLAYYTCTINGHRASAEESQNSWAVCPCTICLLTFCETSFNLQNSRPIQFTSTSIFVMIPWTPNACSDVSKCQISITTLMTHDFHIFHKASHLF